MVKIAKLKRTRLPGEEEDQTVYSEEDREDLVESDQMTPIEEAFMMGWDEADAEEETIEADSAEAVEEQFN